MEKGKFATVLNCMDGRIQAPVLDFVRRETGIEWVDNLAVPGPARAFSESGDPRLLDLIENGLRISVRSHGSRYICIVIHHDCAGCPFDRQTQEDLAREAVRRVSAWFPEATVRAIWVNEDWEVEPL